MADGNQSAAIGIIVLFVPTRWLALRLPDNPLLQWKTLGMGAVAAGAFLGAWSHVVLDSVMHADITPLAPFSNANGLYQVISLTALHGLCIVTGVMGLAVAYRQRDIA